MVNKYENVSKQQTLGRKKKIQQRQITTKFKAVVHVNE